MERITPEQALEKFLCPASTKAVESAFKPFLGLCVLGTPFPLGETAKSDEEILAVIAEGANVGLLPFLSEGKKRQATKLIRVPFGKKIPGGVADLKPLGFYGYNNRLNEAKESGLRHVYEHSLGEILGASKDYDRDWSMTGQGLRPLHAISIGIVENLVNEGVGITVAEMIATNMLYTGFGALRSFREGWGNGTTTYPELLGLFTEAVVIGEKRSERGTWVVYTKTAQ